MSPPATLSSPLTQAPVLLRPGSSSVWKHALTGGLFLAAIWAPAIASRFGETQAADVRREYRDPAPAPELGWERETLAALPADFEAWWNDSFGLRSNLIRGHNALHWFGLGASPDNRFVKGQDGWTFLTDGNALEDYRGAMPFTVEELEEWRTLLETRHDRLERLGSKYLLTFGPNKASVYPDEMSQRWRKIGDRRLDQFLAYMDEHSDLDLLDLRPALASARAEERGSDRLYYPLGSHWTHRGGYVGYFAMAQYMQRWFPDLEPLPRSKVKRTLSQGEGDSWALRMYLEKYLPQEVWHYERISPVPFESIRERGMLPSDFTTVHEDQDLPKALFFSDSFGFRPREFLGEHFSRLVCKRSYDIDWALVENERPAVVMQMFVERGLNFVKTDMLMSPGEVRENTPRLARLSPLLGNLPFECREGTEARWLPAKEGAAPLLVLIGGERGIVLGFPEINGESAPAGARITLLAHTHRRLQLDILGARKLASQLPKGISEKTLIFEAEDFDAGIQLEVLGRNVLLRLEDFQVWALPQG